VHRVNKVIDLTWVVTYALVDEPPCVFIEALIFLISAEVYDSIDDLLVRQGKEMPRGR